MQSVCALSQNTREKQTALLNTKIDSVTISFAALDQIKIDLQKCGVIKKEYALKSLMIDDYTQEILDLTLSAQKANSETFIWKQRYDELFKDLQKSKRNWRIPALVGVVVGAVGTVILSK
jgi:hypothetical protein